MTKKSFRVTLPRQSCCFWMAGLCAFVDIVGNLKVSSVIGDLAQKSLLRHKRNPHNYWI